MAPGLSRGLVQSPITLSGLRTRRAQPTAYRGGHVAGSELGWGPSDCAARPVRPRGVPRRAGHGGDRITLIRAAPWEPGWGPGSEEAWGSRPTI